MAIYYRPENKPRAQALRRDMTRHERRLWYEFLSSYPLRFRRQKQFGPYIVDFYCSAAKLVVELDGSQHFTEDTESYDSERTKYLEQQGLAVLRLPNSELDRDFRAVCEMIDECAKTRSRLYSREENV